jgi:hypothetical protein
MSSKDYLTRYFQQLGKVMAILIGLREKQKYQLALDEVDLVLSSWFGLDNGVIDRLSPEELDEFLHNVPEMNIEKEKSIAELLYQKAITYKAMEKDEEAHLIALKTLTLFKTIDQNSGEFSIDLQLKMAELDQMILGIH